MRQIKPPVGAVKKKKIIGRGTSSGKGRTSTKGHKGIKARAGGGISLGFEGGQMKLTMRMPKVGFSNWPHGLNASEISLDDLEKFYKAGEEVSLVTLKKYELVAKKVENAKILGNGKIAKKLTVAKGIGATASAKKAIEAAGGSFAS
jgi:large subunit ribosomal protein L15